MSVLNGVFARSISDLEHVLFLYTDGCCIGNSTKQECPAGWGVVVCRPCVCPTGLETIESLEKDASKCTLVDELYGPVVLDSKSPNYLGATVASNNTAELSAIGEALVWLKNHISSCTTAQKLNVIVRYDSEYAANSVLGIFNGKKNVELIARIRSIYGQVKGLVNQLSFLHVKGHSGHLYNDKADKLANQGAVLAFGVGGRYSSNASSNPISNLSIPPLSAPPSQETVQSVDSGVVTSSDFTQVLFMYTDGCCIGNSTHRACPSGWGVTIAKATSNAVVAGSCKIDVKELERDASKLEKVDELYGPVVLDQNSPFYLGATVGSNNTAELSAVGEALLWLLAYARSISQQSEVNRLLIKSFRVFIRYDSEYAAKSVEGIFNGKKNEELIHKIRAILRKARNVVGSVTFLHVKGHSGHLYNDRADSLAKQGASMTSGTGGRYSEGDAFNIDITGLEKDTSNAASQSDTVAQAFDTKEVQGRVSHRSATGVELSSGSLDYLAERTRIPVKPVLSLFKNSIAGSAQSGAGGRATIPKTPTTLIGMDSTVVSGSQKRVLDAPSLGFTPNKRVNTPSTNSSVGLASSSGGVVTSSGGRHDPLDLTGSDPDRNKNERVEILDDDVEDEVEEVVFLSEEDDDDDEYSMHYCH